MSKKEKIIFTVFVLISMVAIAVVLVLFIGKRPIKNKENKETQTPSSLELTLDESCVDIVFKGGDTEGYAVVEYKGDVVVEKVREVLKPERVYSLDWLALARRLREEVTVHLSKESGLSNGDVVDVTFNIPQDIIDECGFDKLNLDFTMTVEHLGEINKVDPFEELYVWVEEEDGKLEVVLCHIGEPFKYYGPHMLFNYELEDDAKIGDKLTITFNDEYMYLLSDEGYVLTRESKEYVLGENTFVPISDASELTEDSLFAIKEKANERLVEAYSDYVYVELKEIEYQNTYFTELGDPDDNKIYLLYKVTLLFDEKEIEMYTFLSAKGVFRNDFGEVVILGRGIEISNVKSVINPNTMLQVYGTTKENIMQYMGNVEVVPE